jgi:hypothetical protein
MAFEHGIAIRNLELRELQRQFQTARQTSVIFRGAPVVFEGLIDQRATRNCRGHRTPAASLPLAMTTCAIDFD